MIKSAIRHSLVAVLLIAGCSASHGYKIVGQRNYFDPKQDGGTGGQMIEYTISHDGNTIRARCQTWDFKNNNCTLEVGKEYDLVREHGIAGFDTLCLYDPQDNNQPRRALTVLAVEEERAR